MVSLPSSGPIFLEMALKHRGGWQSSVASAVHNLWYIGLDTLKKLEISSATLPQPSDLLRGKKGQGLTLIRRLVAVVEPDRLYGLSS